ncbi:MAG: hypothetical protein NTU67_13255 [Gemmatimonadetes bacterium]|nr:hypothetical protein [Gemmatimonadota bacterium]
MIHLVLALLVQATDTTAATAPRLDVPERPLFAAVGAPRVEPSPDPLLVIARDTIKPKKKAVAIEYSDWYEKRLTIHRYASWAMLPLFVGQYVMGTTLITKGTDAPQWVKTTHPILATGVAALFATNTVTGAWNWWEGRADPNGRGWRTTHSALMLLADAGFTYVGMVSGQAKQNGDVRDRHRQAAIISGSLAVTSWVMMLKPFRQD